MAGVCVESGVCSAVCDCVSVWRIRTGLQVHKVKELRLRNASYHGLHPARHYTKVNSSIAPRIPNTVVASAVHASSTSSSTRLEVAPPAVRPATHMTALDRQSDRRGAGLTAASAPTRNCPSCPAIARPTVTTQAIAPKAAPYRGRSPHTRVDPRARVETAPERRGCAHARLSMVRIT